jgi:PAS domain S-box-containing protein
VIPRLLEKDPELLKIFGRVAETGKPEKLQLYLNAFQMWFEIATYRTEPGSFVAVFDDITEHKLAEQKLQESEERYRQLFELESDAVILLDCETHRFVDVNPSAQRLYGYSREEFSRLTVEEVSDEPEKTRAMAGSGDNFVPLRRHRKKSGECFTVEITTNTFSYRGRRTELATIRDISARQQVLELLQESAEQLLEAQRLAALGSYDFDAATGTWTSSKVLDELFGITDPDFKRDVAGWLRILHPEDRAELQRYLTDEVLNGKNSFDRVYRIVRLNDGQERWVHGLGKLVCDAAGTVQRMVGVIQDVTENERAKEQMNLQFSALTAAANAITITNAHGVIKWVNPAFTKLTGYTAEEAMGGNPRLLKSGEHPHAFYANMWATILTGNVWRGEIVNRRKDGRLYTEEMTITPVRGANGQIAHFVAIKQDVSDRQLLEKRMRQAQKMEAIGTLAGGIAHDFNNILAAMFGYAYLLQQDVAGNAVAEENIGEILKAAGRAKDLVQQILTFSRQREQKPEVIPLDTIVKEAIKFLRASLPAQIQIDLNLAADAPAVLADPTQIYQVTINLATNALHAMEGRAGRLNVSLERFQPDAKFIRQHPELHPMFYTRLTVADTGHGMDAKTLERIFEPFFTTKPIGKGTGLGLAVVHGIVESHGGVITVESEVGRGTTFRLYFPGQTGGQTKIVAGESSVSTGRGQKILLVDDEPALTGVLKRLLLRLNYQVTTSNRAREAIGWCRQDPRQYDLVITDLTMPEINGLEVARQVRELCPDMPVILASGFSAELNPENLRAAGICELIEKPISITALAEAVRRALEGVKPPEQAG